MRVNTFCSLTFMTPELFSAPEHPWHWLNRYTTGYPAVPLQLRLANTTGLSADDTKQLAHQLNEAAAGFAKQAAVCVFNLVDECQEFLREHNEEAQRAAAAAALAEQQQLEAAAAAAAGEGAAGAQSLWHEMQQRMQQQAAAREAELSIGPGAAGSSPGSNLLGEDLWMFDGGLFAEEGEPHVLGGYSNHTAETFCPFELLLR